MEPCPICKEGMTYAQVGKRDADSVTCPRCGRYIITRKALVNLRNTELSFRQSANISGWLSENYEYEISTMNFANLLNLSTPSFHEKADKLLVFFDKETLYAGEPIRQTISWLSRGWCINESELEELLKFLIVTNRIKEIGNSDLKLIQIEPEGWAHLENLKHKSIDSEQCFVAMWFSEEMKRIYYSSITLGVLGAGFRPHRVDQREHNDKIDDEIIAQIRRSRFVLADFTGHRGGVYFEAGFAKGLNIEVIWTCREDEIEKLHFDIRQYNCIPWNPDNLIDLKNKIKNRIEAVFGHGPYVGKIA